MKCSFIMNTTRDCTCNCLFLVITMLRNLNMHIEIYLCSWSSDTTFFRDGIHLFCFTFYSILRWDNVWPLESLPFCFQCMRCPILFMYYHYYIFNPNHLKLWTGYMREPSPIKINILSVHNGNLKHLIHWSSSP